MSSLRLMQQITERLARTFQDINEAITFEINKIQKPQDDRPILPPPLPHLQEPSEQIYKQKQHGEQPIEQEKPSIIEQAEEKKAAKKIKKAAVTKPKRPLNSFKIFLNKLKKQSQNQDDSEFLNDVTKAATKRWQAMSFEERLPFLEQQKKEQQLYQKNLEEFYSLYPEERSKDEEKKQMKEEKKKKRIMQKQEQKQKERATPRLTENDIEGFNEMDKAGQNQVAEPNEQDKPKDKVRAKREKKQQKRRDEVSQNSAKKKQGRVQKEKQSESDFLHDKIAENVNPLMQDEAQDLRKDLIQNDKSQSLNLNQNLFQSARNPMQQHPASPLDKKPENPNPQQAIAKPEIDQYFDFNESSDSLGGNI